jgi:lipopolysaccharide/colanic/teichoic acid biosynthesis glycosyltransferase
MKSLIRAVLILAGGVVALIATIRLLTRQNAIPMSSSTNGEVDVLVNPAKRAFDVAVSGAALVALSPVLGGLALGVKLSSPGPVLYKATRVGQGGKLIKVYKFRSMVVDADKRGPGVTTSGDSRVTPIGRILRKYKLDELPQLLNVLQGDMSLVGPRPEDPRYVAMYTPEQRRVLQVAPGITSPASLYYRDEETLLNGQDWETQYIQQIMPAKLAIDLDYVTKANLGQDLSIIWRTFQAMWQPGQESKEVGSH